MNKDNIKMSVKNITPISELQYYSPEMEVVDKSEYIGSNKILERVIKEHHRDGDLVVYDHIGWREVSDEDNITEEQLRKIVSSVAETALMVDDYYDEVGKDICIGQDFYIWEKGTPTLYMFAWMDKYAPETK